MTLQVPGWLWIIESLHAQQIACNTVEQAKCELRAEGCDCDHYHTKLLNNRSEFWLVVVRLSFVRIWKSIVSTNMYYQEYWWSGNAVIGTLSLQYIMIQTLSKILPQVCETWFFINWYLSVPLWLIIGLFLRGHQSWIDATHLDTGMITYNHTRHGENLESHIFLKFGTLVAVHGRFCSLPVERCLLMRCLVASSSR